MHISSPFAANLLAKNEDRAVVDEIPPEFEKALKALKLEEKEGEKADEKRLRVERNVKTLLAMQDQLPNDPAGTYIKCLQDEKAKETFKTSLRMASTYRPSIKETFTELEEEEQEEDQEEEQE